MRSALRCVAFGAASLVVVAVLSACGPVKMGAAAVVGDQRISMSSIDASAQEVAELAPVAEEQGNVPAGLTLSRVLDLLIREQARRQGVTYSQSDIDKAIAAATDDQGLKPNAVYTVPLVNGVQVRMPTADAKRFAVSWYLRDVLSKRYGGQDELTARLGTLAEEIGVQVNPRYGEFVEKSLRMRISYGGLWVPAGQAGGGRP